MLFVPRCEGVGVGGGQRGLLHRGQSKTDELQSMNGWMGGWMIQSREKCTNEISFISLLSEKSSFVQISMF